MEIGNPIAVGRTAEIHVWGETQVVKLYRPNFPRGDAEREAELTRAINDLGLPTPAVVDVIEVDGRAGVVFERVTGPTMLQGLMDSPGKAESCAHMLAELQATLHTRILEGLPDLKGRLYHKIERAESLPDAWRSAVLAHLDSLPGGYAVCHGDFHPDNIILTPDGPVIIDWIDVTNGHRLADVARTLWLLSGADLPPDLPEATRRSIERIREIFTAAFLDKYHQLYPFDPDELSRWRLPVVAARLEERIVEENEALLAAVKKGLHLQ